MSRTPICLTMLLLACRTEPAEPSARDAGDRVDSGSISAPDGASPADAASSDPDASPARDGSNPDAMPLSDAEVQSDAEVPSDAGIVQDLCPTGAAHCTSAVAREACLDTPTGRRWMTESCPAGAGCVQGGCVVGACSDECALGTSSGGRTCALIDLATGATARPHPGNSMADRARAYQARIVRDMLPSGGVVSLEYSDSGLNQPGAIADSYDSALWTGTYLIGESLRATATGSVEAKESVERLVRTFHLWFNVHGYPGYLARYAESVDHPPPLSVGWSCAPGESIHCGYVYAGGTYNWRGATSRDQYQGAMTGLAVAYDAPIDESIKALIREDVVTMVEELMVERTMPVEFRVDGVPLTRNITSRYSILNPAELHSGKVLVEVQTSDVQNSSDLDGVREFVPDLADIFRQVPILSWLPNIPRSDSTIMLQSFFLTALHVTDGVAAYAGRRNAIETFYAANVGRWLAITLLWSHNRDCGRKYYATNIGFTPVYNVARLETDPMRSMAIRQDLIASRMWPAVADHKNAHFALIAASALAPAPPAAAIATAQTQLGLFPPPPRSDVAVDSSALFPQDPQCTSPGAPMAQDALDVNLRPADMFAWQRNPWQMVGGGNPQYVYPGVDYVVSYWMARQHGFVTDDRPGICARFH